MDGSRTRHRRAHLGARDDDFDGRFVDYLVPETAVEGLRAALAALDAAREKEEHRE